MTNNQKYNVFALLQNVSAFFYSLGVLYYLAAPMRVWIAWFCLQSSIVAMQIYRYKAYKEEKEKENE